MPLITSRVNPKIKLFRSLHDRKHRDRTRLSLVEGWRLIREAQEQDARVCTIIFAEELCGTEECRLLEQSQVERIPVTPEVLDTLTAGHGRPAIIAVISQSWTSLSEIMLASESVWLAIKDIRHAGSLGTVLRTSDAAGGSGVMLLGDCVDPYDPASVNASHGAVFSQRLIRTSFSELRAWSHEYQCRVVGTSPVGLCDCREAAYQRPLVIMMGGTQGLSPDELAICDQVVRIPMLGRCDSHHVAVAAGVILYEVSWRSIPAYPTGVEGQQRVWQD